MLSVRSTSGLINDNYTAFNTQFNVGLNAL